MESTYIEQIGEDPIFVVSFNPEAKGLECTRDMAALLRENLDRLNNKLYVVIDIRNFPLDFFTLLTMLAESRSEENKYFDGKLARWIVGSGKMVEMAANATSQSQYGGHGMHIATSIEEALAAAQREFQAVGWTPLAG